MLHSVEHCPVMDKILLKATEVVEAAVLLCTNMCGSVTSFCVLGFKLRVLALPSRYCITDTSPAL